MIQYINLHFPSVTSTMDVAKNHFLETPLPWPQMLCISADHQTKGRGRLQRAWSSPVGNLCLTLTGFPPLEEALYPRVTFIASLALYDAIESAGVDPHHLALKWPNDLLLDYKKAGGILLEVFKTHSGSALSIGVGLNLTSFPTDTAFPATSLADHGYSLSPHHARELLEESFSKIWNLYATQGFGAVCEAWRGRVHKTPQIRVTAAAGELTGVFHNLSPEGHLVLATEDGTLHTIMSGDVSFP